MTDPQEQIPLWRQLQACAAALAAVREGHSLTATLDGVAPALRPGVQALSFHVLRCLGRAQALRQLLAKRAPPAPVDALLCTALALAWREEDAPYSPFTLVDQAVEAAKRDPAMRGQANFVNACLRRFLRERDSLVDASSRDPAAVWNHPRWWIEQLRKDHPTRWQDILRANNAHAPLILRVNARKSTVEAYVQDLRVRGLSAHAVGAQGVLLAQPMPVTQLPGFAEGVFSVQDAAAQQAAPLLLGDFSANALRRSSQVGAQDFTPLRVLDACAAPGGKTAHLLELADCEVTALDIDARRCELIGQTLSRLGLQAHVIAADAAQPAMWWDGRLFDAILLDAPCTASGIVRRHPDVRWLRRESDIAQLAAVQQRLLATLWPMLRPGGRLLYCTCSVFKAEGQQQIQTFVAHNTDAVLRPSPGHLMPQTGASNPLFQDNPKSDHDGFFYALLGKRGTALRMEACVP